MRFRDQTAICDWTREKKRETRNLNPGLTAWVKKNINSTVFFLFFFRFPLRSSFALFKQNKSHLYKVPVTVEFSNFWWPVKRWMTGYPITKIRKYPFKSMCRCFSGLPYNSLFWGTSPNYLPQKAINRKTIECHYFKFLLLLSYRNK